MNKFSVKSILLGIGIGIIISSIASMIYIAGRDPFDGLGKDEIMAKAEKYGMVKGVVESGEQQAGILKADGIEKENGSSK